MLLGPSIDCQSQFVSYYCCSRFPREGFQAKYFWGGFQCVFEKQNTGPLNTDWDGDKAWPHGPEEATDLSWGSAENGNWFSMIGNTTRQGWVKACKAGQSSLYRRTTTMTRGILYFSLLLQGRWNHARLNSHDLGDDNNNTALRQPMECVTLKNIPPRLDKFSSTRS